MLVCDEHVVNSLFFFENIIHSLSYFVLRKKNALKNMKEAAAVSGVHKVKLIVTGNKPSSRLNKIFG